PIACRRRPSAGSPRTAGRIGRRVGPCGAITASSSPGPRSRTGSRPPGKKPRARLETDYRVRGLERFRGYLAVAELDAGPFGVLARVDHRPFTRLTDRVREPDPTPDALRALLGDFKAHRDARGRKVVGVPTAGANLSPLPWAAVCPDGPHQVGRFHGLKAITQAILHARAKRRTAWKAGLPTRPRGRPKTAQAEPARRAKRQEPRLHARFAHRPLLVRQTWTAAEGRPWRRITRGVPPRRVLRSIRDAVYRRFDRRGRAATALGRRATLRARVRRFPRVGQALEKLFTPNLEQPLTFLDDKRMPGTSNAVARGHRRYRKAQRSVDAVRTAAHIRQRIARDRHREQRSGDRRRTTNVLHRARAGP